MRQMSPPIWTPAGPYTGMRSHRSQRSGGRLCSGSEGIGNASWPVLFADSGGFVLFPKRVEDGYAGGIEVSYVPGYHRHPVVQAQVAAIRQRRSSAVSQMGGAVCPSGWLLPRQTAEYRCLDTTWQRMPASVPAALANSGCFLHWRIAPYLISPTVMALMSHCPGVLVL